MVTRSQARSRADREATRPQRPAIYCRISDADDELAVTRQEKHARRLGEARGWNMANARVYTDNDISAARKNGKVQERPDFDRLRGDIASGDRDGVLVYDLDRLLRDPEEAEAFYARCERAGMHHILSEADDIHISSGDGLMVARIKAAVAAEEVRRIRQRVSDKKLELAERGLPGGGGRRAYGWSCSPRRTVPRCHRRKCEHDDACRARLEARTKPCTIEGCAHDRGMSLVQPEADGLREAAAKIIGGSTVEAAASVTPGMDDPKVLSRVLRSPRIVGKRQYQGEVIGDAAWPAILDEATWKDVCSELERRKGENWVAPFRSHLLSGIVRCQCGARIYAQVTSRKKGKRGPVVYSCRSERVDRTIDRNGCGKVAIKAEMLEGVVLAEVGRWLDTPAIRDRITELIVGDDGAGEIRELEAQVKAGEARLREIAREREELGLDWVEVEEARRVVKQRLEAARTRLSAARRRSAAASPLGDVTAEEIAVEWREGDYAARREIIGLLAKVTVRSAGKQWRTGQSGYDTAGRVKVWPVWEEEPA